MLKRFALISGLVAALSTPLAWAQSQQSHPFETLRGLERFNKSQALSLDDTSQAVDTALSIKEVKIGDNVLQQAINLVEEVSVTKSRLVFISHMKIPVLSKK